MEKFFFCFSDAHGGFFFALRAERRRLKSSSSLSSFSTLDFLPSFVRSIYTRTAAASPAECHAECRRVSVAKEDFNWREYRSQDSMSLDLGWDEGGWAWWWNTRIEFRRSLTLSATFWRKTGTRSGLGSVSWQSVIWKMRAKATRDHIWFDHVFAFQILSFFLLHYDDLNKSKSGLKVFLCEGLKSH